MIVPASFDSVDALVSFAARLSPLRLRLLDEVCGLVHFPDGPVPPAVAGFQVAFYAASDGSASPADPAAAAAFSLLPSRLSLGREVAFAESFLRRLCLVLAAGEVVSGELLVPFRLVVSVPEEWLGAVLEAVPHLGLERALSLPVVAS